MKFYTFSIIEDNKGQNTVWKAIEEAFDGEDGIAFYRFPIYSREGFLLSEPDVLLVLKRFGVFVLECKGMYMYNVKRINGHLWEMDEWHSAVETPVSQSLRHAFRVKNLLEQAGLRQIRVHDRVVLPFISRQDWEKRGYHQYSPLGSVALQEDLTAVGLREWVRKAHEQAPFVLAEESWLKLLNVFVTLSGEGLPGTPGKLILLEYEAYLPDAGELRRHIPLGDDGGGDPGQLPSYTYLVATSALSRIRARQGFFLTHQVSKEFLERGSGGETPRLVFHQALRYFLKNTPLLTRAEERVLLQRAAGRVALEMPETEMLLKRDIFAWRDALAVFDAQGIALPDRVPPSLRQEWAHPGLEKLMGRLQGEYFALQQREHKQTFERAAYHFLKEVYRPTPCIIMEGFSRLTPLQQLFIDRSIALGATIYFIQPYRAGQGRGFRAIRQIVDKLQPAQRITMVGRPLTVPQSKLDVLQKTLFADAAVPAAPQGDETARSLPSQVEMLPAVTHQTKNDLAEANRARNGTVSLRPFLHPNKEVAACVAEIQTLLAEDKDRKITIVTRDVEQYIPLLAEEAAFVNRQYPERVPVDFRIPPQQLLLTPLGRFVLTLYEVWQEDALQLTADQLETVLASGWLGGQLQNTTDEFVAVRAQLFEQCQSEPEWRTQFTNLRRLISELKNTGTRVPAASVDPDTVMLWEEAIKQIKTLCRRLFQAGEQTIGQHMKLLLDELDGLDAYNIRDTEKEVLEKIRKAFEELAAAHSIRITPAEFGQVLNSLVRERATPDEDAEVQAPGRPEGRPEQPQTSVGISVTSPDAVDCSDDEQVIFYLGANSQSLPLAYREPWPRQTGEIRQHQEQERYLFLAVVRAAREGLHLYYSKSDDKNAYQPSIYLDEVDRMLGLHGATPTDGGVAPTSAVVVGPRKPQPPMVWQRYSYSFHEIAHFRLCPYRYKLERLDGRSRRYESAYQLNFLASGRWLNRMMDWMRSHQSTAVGQEGILNLLTEAGRATQPDIKDEFPGLQSADWITVKKYVRKIVDDLVREHGKYPNYSFQIVAPAPAGFRLFPGNEKPKEVDASAPYAIQRVKIKYPALHGLVSEEWLHRVKKPKEKNRNPLKVVGGVTVFEHKYDAIQWWEKGMRTAFDKSNYYGQYDQEPYRNFTREVEEVVTAIEAGHYPLNPGEHCKACPVRSACFGIKI